MSAAVGATLGVEEEYQLVDATTLALADRPQVVATAKELLGDGAQSEISTSQLEIGTVPVTGLAELRAELVRLRRGARQAAERHGCLLVAAATHPTARWTEQRLTPGPRYRALVERWGLLALQQLITGCHVHVSVEDPEIAVRLLGHLRPHLPTLLALTASSPYWEGTDTAAASYRTTWYSRWPVTGPPPALASRAEHDALVADLVAAGIVDDASHLYWDARPSVRYPTVEVRVADTCPLLDDAVLHAGLARALVQTAAGAAERGEPAPVLPSEVVLAARWRAARFGLEGPLLDVARRAQRPAADVVRDLLALLRPALEATGDLAQVTDLLAAALGRGTSASRQRAAVARTGQLRAATALLVEETVRGL